MKKKKKLSFSKRKADELSRMQILFASMTKNNSIVSEVLGARDADILISLMLGKKSVIKLATLYDLSESAVRSIFDRSFSKCNVFIEKYGLFYKKYSDLQKRNIALVSEIEELRSFIHQIRSGGNTESIPASRTHMLDSLLEKKDFNSRLWEYFFCIKGITTLGQLLDCKLMDIKKFRNIGVTSIFELIDFISQKGFSFKDQDSFIKKFRCRKKPFPE